jgi:hypothetical protein
VSDTTNDIDALLEQIGRYDMFGFKGQGDMLYGLAFALKYLDAQPHSMQRARARASVADMKDLVIPIGQTLSDAGRALRTLVAERDALKARVAELEAHPPADRDRDRELRERLVCAALTGACSLEGWVRLEDLATHAVGAADATLAAMRKGEA